MNNNELIEQGYQDFIKCTDPDCALKVLKDFKKQHIDLIVGLINKISKDNVPEHKTLYRSVVKKLLVG